MARAPRVEAAREESFVTWGWFITGLLLGAASVVGGLEYLGRRPIRVPLRQARCTPERQRVSGSTLVYGATETYSHPQATEHLRGAHWVMGGSA